MSVMYNHYQSEYGFNISKNYDLAINHLKCVQEDIFRSTRLQGSDLEITDSPMIVSRFSRIPQFENILATGNEDGIVMIHNIGKHLWSSERNSSKVVAQTHLNVIFDLAWSPSSYQLVTASGDHTAVLWDVRDDELKYLYRFHGHSRSIKTISFKPEDKHIFATGGRDGLVIIWDTRLAKPDVQTVSPDNIIASNNVQTREFYKKRNPLRMDSITSVIFKNSFAVISGSAYDPLIKVWDIRNSYSAYKRTPLPCYKMLIPDVKKTSNGVSSLVMDSTGTRMYANCMDGTIYCYNTSTYLEQPIMSYWGHQNSSFYVKSCLSPDDRYLISGSSDDSAYIWNIKKQDPIGRLVGHSAEVTTIDWSKSNETKLLTCSDDGSCRVWRLHYKNFEKEELKGWVEPLKVTKSTTLENFKSCITSCNIKRGIQEQTGPTIKN
uniref:Uncharacterized protein n=2 Tax=Clastoptera arizonana TaxID=38151 RepID=A0A1B6BYW3_9HEMI